MKISIVVPTIREQHFYTWVEKWKTLLDNSKVFVVEDNPHKTFRVDLPIFEHFSWEEIDAELKDNSWIIPRRTSAIRSFGFYKAYQDGADVIITLDDDCYPTSKDFFKVHLKYLFEDIYSSRWIQHSQSPRVRGFPLSTEKIEVVINMGLWANIPDFDGETQKQLPDFRTKAQQFNFPIPFNYFAPISSMNLAVKRKVVPSLYFLLMGPSYPYDRFDDIWAGIFLKKICDHLGLYISGGEPFVWHDRASNVEDNIRKEAPGKIVNEYLWKDIDKIRFLGKSFKDCYRELANKLLPYDEYWRKQSRAMKIWVELF